MDLSASGSVVRREPRKMLCAHCVEKWQSEGKDPEHLPRKISHNEIKKGLCPDCGCKFRNYVRF